jgi:hypothetical protein
MLPPGIGLMLQVEALVQAEVLVLSRIRARRRWPV